MRPKKLLLIDVPSVVVFTMRLGKSGCLVASGAVFSMLGIDVSTLFHVGTVDIQSSTNALFQGLNSSWTF